MEARECRKNDDIGKLNALRECRPVVTLSGERGLPAGSCRQLAGNSLLPLVERLRRSRQAAETYRLGRRGDCSPEFACEARSATYVELDGLDN
jgi:hypothetical protein